MKNWAAARRISRSKEAARAAEAAAEAQAAGNSDTPVSSAIRAEDSTGVTVRNSHSFGYDVLIDAENCDDVVVEGSTNTPRPPGGPPVS